MSLRWELCLQITVQHLTALNIKWMQKFLLKCNWNVYGILWYNMKNFILGVLKIRDSLKKSICQKAYNECSCFQNHQKQQNISSKTTIGLLHFIWGSAYPLWNTGGSYTPAPNNHTVTQRVGWWPPFCIVFMSVCQKHDLISHPSVASLISAWIKSQFTKGCRYKNAEEHSCFEHCIFLLIPGHWRRGKQIW